MRRLDFRRLRGSAAKTERLRGELARQVAQAFAPADDQQLYNAANELAPLDVVIDPNKWVASFALLGLVTEMERRAHAREPRWRCWARRIDGALDAWRRRLFARAADPPSPAAASLEQRPPAKPTSPVR